MQKTTSIVLLILSLFFLSGCSESHSERKVDTSKPEPLPEDTPVDDTKVNESTFNVVIGNVTYTASYADTETARAFKERLPISAEMTELNGNEKYLNLDASLPESDSVTGVIHSGDIMLYGEDCVVLFYKDFETNYSYSPIGHIDDPKGLDQTVGSGNIEVTFN